MVPNMAIDWFIWNRNDSKVGVVSIHLSKWSWLEEGTIFVESRLRRAGLKGIVGGAGDIPHGSGVDILQGQRGQGRRDWRGLGV